MHLLLHIGSPKTGTTGIQRTLHNQVASLQEHGIFYPQLPDEENHNLLSVPFRTSLHRMFWRRYGTDQDLVTETALAHWQTIAQQAATHPPKHMILSGEFFFGLMRQTDLLEMLATQFPQITRITVLCYIRSPADFFVSELQQRLKASHTLINRAAQATYFQNCLSRWLAASGINIVVRPFSRAEMVKGDILQDLFSYGGISDAPSDLRANDANTTVSAEAMYLLHRFREFEFPDQDNHFKPASDQLLVMLRKIEDSDGGFETYNRPRLKEPYLGYFHSASPDAVFMRNQFGLTFPNIDYAAKLAWPEQPVTSVADLIQVDMDKVSRLNARLTHHLIQQQLTHLEPEV